MPKRAKKVNKDCEEHLFCLKPKHNYCRYGQTISISFCDFAKDNKKNTANKSRNRACLQCPVFNKDKNYATPTFVLVSQRQYYEQRGLKIKEQHQNKMVEYTDEKESLNIPKPRTKNNFCSVCRQVYEDYLEHIESQKHKKKINASHVNRYILDIVQKFNPSSKNLFGCFNHTLSTRDQDEVEILDRKPRKKIKTDQQYKRFDNFEGNMQPNIAPPPHISINQSGYCPRYPSQFNFMPNPALNQFPMPYPMDFNYNMNFLINPLNYAYPSLPYSFFNPVDYFAEQQMRMRQSPRVQQNYFVQQNINQQLYQWNNNHFPYFGNRIQEKRQHQQFKNKVIVIGDDQEQKPLFKKL